MKQGGDVLIAELSAILESRLSYLADLRTDIANLQERYKLLKVIYWLFLLKRKRKAI